MTWYNQNMDDLAADEAKLIDECLKKAYNKTIISLTFGCLNALISLLIIFLFIDAATHCSISVISEGCNGGATVLVSFFLLPAIIIILILTDTYVRSIRKITKIIPPRIDTEVSLKKIKTRCCIAEIFALCPIIVWTLFFAIYL